MDAWYTGHHLAHRGHAELFVFEGGYATDGVGANAVAVLLGFWRD